MLPNVSHIAAGYCARGLVRKIPSANLPSADSSWEWEPSHRNSVKASTPCSAPLRQVGFLVRPPSIH
eukprot:2105876-Pyramimonas_sp.AAC.1